MTHKHYAYIFALNLTRLNQSSHALGTQNVVRLDCICHHTNCQHKNYYYLKISRPVKSSCITQRKPRKTSLGPRTNPLTRIRVWCMYFDRFWGFCLLGSHLTSKHELMRTAYRTCDDTVPFSKSLQHQFKTQMKTATNQIHLRWDTCVYVLDASPC